MTEPREQDHESGMAMVLVLLSLTALMALAVAALQYGLGSQTASNRDADWQGALSAAEAGIDNYLFHMNENGNYTLYSSANPPPDGNLAFSQYVPVPGGSTDSTYRYTADTSKLGTDGTITLSSTGKVGDRTRTVEATIRRRSFLDYLYFTDFETQDPASYTGSPYSANQAQTYCAKYYYAGRNSNCSDIQFITADTIKGPLHSNDAILMCGSPTFTGNTSTSWNKSSGNRWRDNCPTSHPNFANPGDPAYSSPLALPPSNSAIKTETIAGSGGCLYTGPTRIRLLSNGQMTVKSPFSKNTNNGCPTNGTGSLPTNGVIYTQNVPSQQSDPNYTKNCPYNVSGEKHPLGLPISQDITDYGCRDGDVFIEGTLKGRLTVAADNNIVVTWDLKYKDGLGGSDLLGLIANNYIEVWHPVKCSSGSSNSCNLDADFPGEADRNDPFEDPTIQAAMLAVNHSVRNQKWNIGGPTGTFTIQGVMAQRYRGPVGTGSGGSISTGLAKDYQYDQRLKYQSPPKFLDPVASAWAIAVWKEVGTPTGL